MLTVSSTVKEKAPVPEAFFVKATQKILGKKYELSLVFIGKKKMLHLNSTLRKKHSATDILSLELEKDSGEIFINLEKTRRKSPLFGRSYKNYLKFVFIHGLCHLKGMAHGSRMENEEKKFRKILNV